MISLSRFKLIYPEYNLYDPVFYIFAAKVTIFQAIEHFQKQYFSSLSAVNLKNQQ